MTDKKKFYSTGNLEESAFLICRGHFLKETKGINGKFFYVFEDSLALRENLNDYFSGAGLISIQSYISAFNRTRDLLCRWRRAQGGAKI